MNAESLRWLEQLARRVESLLTAWGEMEESEKRDAIAADIRSFAALAQAGEGVPPGMVLVPMEPTSYMIEESTGGSEFHLGGCVSLEDARNLLRRQWAAMLAAAPAAQGVEDPGRINGWRDVGGVAVFSANPSSPHVAGQEYVKLNDYEDLRSKISNSRLSDRLCEARNLWAEQHEANWLETDQNHPDEWMANYLRESIVGAAAPAVVVDEAMVTRVARAMFESEDASRNGGWTWEECSPIEVDGWMSIARAACAALGQEVGRD